MRKFLIISILFSVLLLICMCYRPTNNEVIIDMVLVEGDEFYLGVIDTLQADSLHGSKLVEINDYYISRYEVNQRIWFEVMGYNHSENKNDLFPIENVSWYDCIMFCNNLSLRNGYQPYYNLYKDSIDKNNHNSFDKQKWLVTINENADGYRLPTEAEWEYAARGGKESNKYYYAGSNDVSEVAWFGFYTNAGGTSSNSPQTRQIGQLTPNELGLYDMSGNVWEWCYDWFGVIHNDKKEYNPRGASFGEYRTAKGGSWAYSKFGCVVTARDDLNPTYKDIDIGFRVVRSAKKIR